MKAVAALLLAAAANAQDLAVELRLAADPTRRGPTAWTWVRERLVPQCDNWPANGDPFAATTIRWRDGQLAFASADANPNSDYATSDATLGGTRVAAATCAWSGDETWRVTQCDSLPHHLTALVTSLGLDVPGAQSLDIAILAGQIIRTPSHDGGPLVDLVTRGAVECGEVRFAAEPREKLLIVRGASAGGLTLPLAILMLASLGGDLEALDDPAPIDELQRWRMLAFAARDSARIEATAQLARLGDPLAIETLERLLWSENSTRAHAMDGLIRSGAAHAMPALVRAARDDITTTPELAHAAVVNLWNEASSSERERTRATLPSVDNSSEWFATQPPAGATGIDPLRAFLLGLLAAISIVTLVYHERLRRSAPSLT